MAVTVVLLVNCGSSGGMDFYHRCFLCPPPLSNIIPDHHLRGGEKEETSAGIAVVAVLLPWMVGALVTAKVVLLPFLKTDFLRV